MVGGNFYFHFEIFHSYSFLRLECGDGWVQSPVEWRECPQRRCGRNHEVDGVSEQGESEEGRGRGCEVRGWRV